jgi:hypothetical protein
MPAIDWTMVLVGFVCAAAFDLGLALANRICWRSAKLNHYPGLYFKAWGKWYRIIAARRP